MKIVIFGLGSIGSRQARLVMDNYDHDVTAFRSGSSAGTNELGIKEISSWGEVRSLGPEIAFITNPTSLHVPTALRCAELGMHLFIEKPLSNSLADLDRLKSVCERRELTCYTAYCLRFHPVIKELKRRIAGKRLYHVRVSCSSYLPDWRPDRDVKNSYSANKSAGGGVLLDLSHEFDYIRYLFGDLNKMTVNYGRVSGVTVDAEDYADILMKAGDVPVNLHLDYFSRFNERRIIVDYEGGGITGDLINYQITIKKGAEAETINYPIARDAYLKEQLDYFFGHLGGKQGMMNGLDEAGRLLSAILELKNG